MEFNQRVIEEFRRNGGRVGGMFEGAPLVLLTTQGARSGAPRTNPAVYFRDGARLLVFASNAGAPHHPAWYHNLLAYPQVTVEIGEDGRLRTYATQATPLEGAERDRHYREQAERDPAFAEYQRKTTRVIPVVALHPLALGDGSARVEAVSAQLRRHHAELRAELARLREALAAGVVPDAPQRALAEHCLTFCDHLDLHHIRENGAFTAFEDHSPALRPAIARLRAEHHVVAEKLAELRSVLTGGADPGRIGAALDRITDGLEEHFAYEEASLFPAA
ncbi:nitroreductase/quinone reductase family protein [Amycolatopsis acidicola]|uniref:nitroreductase/quinone reductase family protein n=1 Tax=Amycolatopsis acidicola TaxID=2596893 RepID=UPI001AA07274|nr:nitroreductase/quinone reductase family protein [Amycolatopsis acidicola]